jgi:hypothetical protein
MDCEKIRDRFSSLWEKELTPVEKKTVEEHLSSCPACRREFEQFEKTMKWLHSAGELEVPDGFLPELLKKMDERKRIAPDKKVTERWFNFPLSLRLPVQAVAMVAIVFLVLYLTKMMPVEKYHPKETEETSSHISLKKKPASELALPAAPSPVPKAEIEKRRSAPTLSEPSHLGRGVEGLAQKGGERERVALKTSPQAPHPKDVEQAGRAVPGKERSEAYAPQVKAGEKKVEVTASKTEEMREGVLDLKEAARAKTPSSEPEKVGRKFAGVGKPLVAPKPPQEIVLRTSDREKAISQLDKLVKQFGGEILTKEEGTFIASLPRGSFSEFEKELAELSASTRTDKVFTFMRKSDTGDSLASQRVMEEEIDKKSKESVKLADDAAHWTIVRILLIQE